MLQTTIVGSLPKPGSTPEEYAAFLRGERTKWGTVAKAAGVKRE